MGTLMSTVYDKMLDLLESFKYDLLRFPLPEMPEVNLKGRFDLHKDSGGGYWITSEGLPGLYASGDSLEELRKSFFDALLTYYDVPRARAVRIPDNLELKLREGTVISPPEKNAVSVIVQLAGI